MYERLFVRIFPSGIRLSRLPFSVCSTRPKDRKDVEYDDHNEMSRLNIVPTPMTKSGSLRLCATVCCLSIAMETIDGLRVGSFDQSCWNTMVLRIFDTICPSPWPSALKRRTRQVRFLSLVYLLFLISARFDGREDEIFCCWSMLLSDGRLKEHFLLDRKEQEIESEETMDIALVVPVSVLWSSSRQRLSLFLLVTSNRVMSRHDNGSHQPPVDSSHWMKPKWPVNVQERDADTVDSSLVSLAILSWLCFRVYSNQCFAVVNLIHHLWRNRIGTRVSLSDIWRRSLFSLISTIDDYWSWLLNPWWFFWAFPLLVSQW